MLLKIINLQGDEILHEKCREVKENLCNIYEQFNDEKYLNKKKEKCSDLFSNL